MALRVLHCLWSGEIGGAERAVEQLVRAQLQDAETAPALMFGQGKGLYWERAQTLGCPVLTLDLPHGHSIPRIPRVASAMKRFDVHHFHSAETSLMMSSVLCRSARRVYTHRGGVTEYPLKARVRYAATGVLLRHRFHAFSGNTAHAVHSAASLFAMSPDAFRVTYNGIQFDLLKPRRDAAEIRNELHLDSESFVFGTAANLKPWKRIDRLLTAVENISARHVRVLIVGDGVDRSRLEAIVKERRLASRVVFAGAQSHVADYLQVMDAFCLPSTGLESFGNAVVEAMALALPVIIFADGGGMVEHIDDGRTGFIVAGQEGLEDRLCTLLDDPTLRSRIGTAASTSVRARYTPERAIRAYRDLYAAALG